MSDAIDHLAKADAEYVVRLLYDYGARGARCAYVLCASLFLLWVQSHPGNWWLIAPVIAALTVTNVTKWVSVVALSALTLTWLFPSWTSAAKMLS